MKKQADLINECRKYIPLDGRVLVHALKLRQIKQEDYSFDVADTKANEGKDPSKHRVDLIKVQPKVNAKYQVAIVLQVPFDENRFKPGDTIVYPCGAINPFDLVKGVSVLRKYDVVAIVNDNEITGDKNYGDIEGRKGNTTVAQSYDFTPVVGVEGLAGYTS